MKKIKIGTIVNTHGLKGEVKVKSFSEFNEIRFAVGNKVCIDYHNEMLELIIETYKEHKGMVLISFKELNDINLVEKYRNCDIYIQEDELHTLENDEVYYYELMECEVFDEDGNYLGIVEDVLETGANAVIRVNKTILIPYVHDFIKVVDIKNKKIIVHMMKGLL